MNLKKLLIDLLHNSAKFISHGEIVICSEEGEIIIKDTACGINPLFFPHLCEAYSSWEHVSYCIDS